MTIEDIESEKAKSIRIHDAAAKIVAILDEIESEDGGDAREEVERLVQE